MSRDGVWGGDIEMTALCESMKFNVILHNVGAPKMIKELHKPMGSVPTV